MKRTFAFSVGLVSLILLAPSAHAWDGFADQSQLLNTASFSFTGSNPDAGTSNENYYDADMADFDGDGLPDRIAGSRYGFLFNTGSGLMVPARKYNGYLLMGDPGAAGWGEDAMQSADMDGDGDLDALAGGNGEPFTLQWNRAGRFTTGFVITSGNHSALNIVNTDLERDGDVDLVVAHAFCSDSPCGGPVDFALFLNDGMGNVTEVSAARGLGFGATAHITGVVSGDVDGDGDFDLVIAHGGGNNTIIALNNGAGSFTQDPQPIAPPGSGFGQGMNLGDIDGDGDLDLVVGRGGPPFVGGHPTVANVIAINDGAGNFADESTSRWDDAGTVADFGAENGKLVDIDYDGDLDFVGFAKDNQAATTHLMVFLNDGTGLFQYDAPHSTAGSGPNSGLGSDVDLADLDGDGALDVWVGVSGADVRILRNTYVDPTGERADAPRDVSVISETAAGVTLEWDPPPFAANARAYRVLRSTARGMDDRDKRVIKTVGFSRFQDEGFAAPILPQTTTAELNDPSVTLTNGTVRFTDTTALAGVTYYYAIAHVGTENWVGRATDEVSASVPAAGGSDTLAPTLDIIGPTTEEWSRLPRIVANFGDGGSGIDPSSLHVSFDQPLGGGAIAANTNLIDQAYRADGDALVLPLLPPSTLPLGTLATLTIRVSDMDGNEAVATRQLFPSVDSPVAPTAMMAALTPPMNPLGFSADGSADADGRVMRWEWYFGDGTTGIGRNVTKRYATAGTYDVRVLVRDDHGGAATATQSITVDGPPPGGGGAGGDGGSGGGGGEGGEGGNGNGGTSGGGANGSGASGADGDQGSSEGCDCATFNGARTTPMWAGVMLAMMLARRTRRPLRAELASR